METKLKSQVSTFFKVNGFHVRSNTAMILVQKMMELEINDKIEFLNKILTSIQRQNLENTMIEDKHIIEAIRDCSHVGFSSDAETIFNVINAFEVPSFSYHKDTKKFVPNKRHRSLLPSANSRSEYIQTRYNVLMQRILRHELFATNPNELIKSNDDEQKKFNLKLAENLLASSTCKSVVMLGLLSKFKEGKFYLEDPSGAVLIDLTNADFHSGLYTEGSLVLAEGTYNDGVLIVSGLGFAPPEPSSSSRAYFGTLNYWGGTSQTLLKYSKKLLEYERLNFSGTIIYLSDCWLDDAQVLDKLKKLFHGYDDSPPIAIILMGPFFKSKLNYTEMRAKFASLATIIDSTYTLKNETDIVLVPDLEDPSSVNILPRPPLPQALVYDLTKKCKRIILATNPCRLQYCTQQIVVCRMDLLKKLCRNTIKFPDNGNLEDHFARSLICQGTLSPFTQLVMPTYWDFDAALSLYPLPDMIVIGDSSTDFQTTHLNCMVVNTGSFPRSKYSFKVYLPSNKTIEDSQIPDDEDDAIVE